MIWVKIHHGPSFQVRVFEGTFAKTLVFGPPRMCINHHVALADTPTTFMYVVTWFVVTKPPLVKT